MTTEDIVTQFLTQAQNNQNQTPDMFQEPQNGFEVSMPSFNSVMNLNGGNIPIIALGVILSENVGSFVGRFTQQATIVKWGAVLAGFILITVGKRNRMIHSFGAGVFIGGLATVFRDVVMNATGSLGLSEPSAAFQEQRVTWGGVDGGVNVTSPDRRVIS